MYRKSMSLALVLLVATVFTLPAEAGTVISNVNLPLTGSFFYSATNEWVDITGTLPLVAAITHSTTTTTATLVTGDPVKVTAIGRTSGLPYQINGFNALQVTSPHLPNGIPSPILAPVTFGVTPPPGASVAYDLIEYTLLMAFVALASAALFDARVDTTNTSVSVIGTT